jgi:hypothetical protein
MAPKGPLPCSQEPSTGSNPEPDQSGPYHPIPSLQGVSQYYPIYYILAFQVISFLLASPLMSYMHFILNHSCYMPCITHLPWLDYSNFTCQRVLVMKLIMQPFPTSCHFSSIQISFSAPCPTTPSVYVILNVRYLSLAHTPHMNERTNQPTNKRMHAPPTWTKKPTLNTKNN